MEEAGDTLCSARQAISSGTVVKVSTPPGQGAERGASYGKFGFSDQAPDVTAFDGGARRFRNVSLVLIQGRVPEVGPVVSLEFHIPARLLKESSARSSSR